MPARFDAWSAATWTALWTRPWSKHSDGDRLRGRSLRRSVGGFLGQEEVKRLAGRRPFANHRFVPNALGVCNAMRRSLLPERDFLEPSVYRTQS